jgi:hypothetical protein
MKATMALFIVMLVMGAVACGPTTDTIEAPFETTSDFSSSTTPGDSTLTGPAKARWQLDRYVFYSYDNVSTDIARGNGEYLTSLAVLAGVPPASRPAFQAEMQSRYAAMYDARLSRKDVQRVVVNHAWLAGYGRTADGHDAPPVQQ